MLRTLQKTDARIHYTILKHQPTRGCCLRTQQCANTPPTNNPSTPVPRPRRAVLASRAATEGDSASSSTWFLEQPPPVNERHGRDGPPTCVERQGVSAP